jgi:hypothetical protein
MSVRHFSMSLRGPVLRIWAPPFLVNLIPLQQKQHKDVPFHVRDDGHCTFASSR